MKRTFLLLLLLVLSSNICQPLFARTAKEYFHQELSNEAIMDDWNDRVAYESIMNEVRAYVFGELLPSMDSNSIAYVDTLFKYLDYVSYYDDDKERTIALAQQARRIVLAQEGKSPRYVKSIEYELSTRGIYGYYVPEAEVTRAQQLLGELIDYYHQTSRPTDVNYIYALRRMYLCVFVNDICPPSRNTIDNLRYELNPNMAYKYNEAAFVWNDLLAWNDITIDEYDSICHNYVTYIPEDYTCLSMYGDYDADCESFSYRSHADYPAYLDLLHAHVQLLRRTNDLRYYGEAADLVTGLQWRAYAYMQDHDGEPDSYHWIDTAYMHSKILTQAFPASSGTDVWNFINIHLAAAACRMSVEGYTADLQSELQRLYNICDQGIKENREQKTFGTKEQLEQGIEDPLYESAAAVLTLQAEGELLNGNDKNAVMLQRQACKMADKFSMTAFNEPATSDYVELMMIAVASHDQKTFEELKRDGLIYTIEYWKYITPRLCYTPYRYKLEQLFEQNVVEIFGQNIPLEHASLTNNLACEEIWQPIRALENEDEEDEDGYVNGYSKSVEIGGLFYYLNEQDKTATVTYPRYTQVAIDKKKSNNDENENDEDEDEYEGDDEYDEEDEYGHYIYHHQSVKIPSKVKYNGTKYTVTRIGSEAFANSESLVNIIIPNSITVIEEYAFEKCPKLTKISIPNNVVSIEEGAFKHCDGLTYATIGAKDIGAKAFFSNRNLKSVTIRDGVKHIGQFAFEYCSSLSSLTLPKSITRIEEEAFAGCDSLTSVAIPADLTDIKRGAFCFCKRLTDIHVASGNPAYCSIDGVLFNKDKTFLVQYPAGRQGAYAIPNGVIRILDVAFLATDGLNRITIPNSVEYIGISAFMGCEGLTEVVVPQSVTYIGNGAFENCVNLMSVVWNAIGKDDVGIEGIHISSFSYASNEHAPFTHCDKITSFTFGNKVKIIPQLLCAGLTGLTELAIPNSVKLICYGAFSGCLNIKNLVIPESVDSIMDHAFGALKNSNESLCSRIPNVIYHGSASGSPWDALCINGYTEGAFVYTDKSKTIIAACTAVDQTEITIPATVTTILSDAFENCQLLNSIVWLPNDQVEQSDIPFYNIALKITTFAFGNNLTRVRSSVCYGMENLKEITIPANVTQIGEWAFTHCMSLTSLTIPANVKEIGAMAFYNCSRLKSITCLAETPPALGTIFLEEDNEDFGVFLAIDNEGTDIPLYVPAGSVEAYRQAKQWKDFKTILPISE